MTVLELDIGNSRIHWRLLTDGGVTCREVIPAGDPEALRERLATVGPVNRIRAVSVRDAAAEAVLAATLREATGVTPAFAVTRDCCAGVTNSYTDPTRMGTDRWLALLAAFDRVRDAVVVVDAGTALTVDVLEPDGRHGGGYIVPGLGLMHATLRRETGRVRYEPAPADGDLAPGTATETAVNHGLILMLVGLVETTVARLAERLGRPVPVLLCGGDAEIMQRYLTNNEVRLEPDLVMDGLRLALP